ncbi:hypothetical protein Tco_1355142 [Tanacetum coccineum]
MTPPPGFSTLTPLPGPNVSELQPITASTFNTRTPKNAPLTNHASTSNNPDLMISPALVEANYEVLESLLRERRRHMHNEDLRTELEYFSEEYDEEREMKPRLMRAREATLVLQAAEGSRVERNEKGGRPLRQRTEDNGPYGMNLPPLLAAHLGRTKNGQPLQSSLTSIHGGRHLSTNIRGNVPPNAPTGSSIPESHGLMHPSGIFPNIYPLNAQPMFPSPNVPIYPNLAPNGLFTDYTGCVTPFVYWIEGYPLLDGLKMPLYVGSYDRKGDPDNFLHLFEGAIRMQKWAMLVACHMFAYTLKDSAQIWWNGQKREGESSRAFVTRYTDDTLQILGLHE